MQKAITYSSFGDSSVLTLSEIPVAEPGPGQVRVQVHYSGVNPVDWKMRQGYLSGGQPLAAPQITGMDMAGIVDAVGPGVAGFAPGDRVAGLVAEGTAAEYVVAYAAALAPLPDSVTLASGASVGVTGTTAVRALGQAGVAAGESILVDGGAGGVGIVLTQLALARGIRVVATASERNHDHLRALGVTPVAHGDGWEERALQANGGSFNAAFDLVTGGKLDSMTALTGSAAKVVTLVDPAVAEAGGVLVTGLEPGFDGALREVVAALAEGGLSVPVQQIFPLAEADAAQDLSAEGHVRGKLLLAVAA
ncbi:MULTISPECIES: NADP-dependent oxidoreductase [Arthrobacter]|uniref:NADP-dependent oxidoreductase n=2 Tax=Arthrobacter TaxID=1663 RepID=A0ABU9KLV1_9MICC|nr:NADP-dependent oxidoreductase [Arthrobacter sp. YJM1]MDP5226466.1 NADP-dependent oxidoreductase [Arthrobacter sp. YJM1]